MTLFLRIKCFFHNVREILLTRILAHHQSPCYCPISISRGQSQTTFWALLKESSKLLGYLVIMDNGTKNMCQSPVIPVIWLLVTYLICKTGPIAHATPLSLVIWLFGYWWQLICKTGPCISSVTGYLVIWLLTFYYLVFLRPWRLRGPRGEYFSNN